MRFLLSFLWITVCITSFQAQEKQAYLYTHGKLATGYELLVSNSSNSYAREFYVFFKGRIWLQEIRPAGIMAGSADYAGNYVETKGQKTKKYRSYATCDPEINYIRNSALQNRMEDEADSVLRLKAGYSSTNGYWSFKGLHRIPDSLLRVTCTSGFHLVLIPVKQQLLAYIDSLDQLKKAQLNQIISDPGSIDAAFILEFLKKLDHNETDIRSLERIIVLQPDVFTSLLYRLTEGQFRTLTIVADEFPKDIDLEAAKAALKNIETKNPRKRKLLKRMGYKAS